MQNALNLDGYWKLIVSMAESEARRKPGRNNTSPVYPKPLLPKAAALITFAALNGLVNPPYRTSGFDFADLNCQIVPTMRFEAPRLLKSQIVSMEQLWYVCVAVDLIGRRGRIVGYAHKEDVRYTEDYIDGAALIPWTGLPFRSK